MANRIFEQNSPESTPIDDEDSIDSKSEEVRRSHTADQQERQLRQALFDALCAYYPQLTQPPAVRLHELIPY